MIAALLQSAAPAAAGVSPFTVIAAIGSVVSVVATALSLWKQGRDAAAAEAAHRTEFKRLDDDVKELKNSHASQDGEMRSQLRQLLELVQGMKIDIARLQERDSLAKELAALRRDREGH